MTKQPPVEHLRPAEVAECQSAPMRIFVSSASLDSHCVDELRSVLRDCAGSFWDVHPPVAVHPDWQQHVVDALEHTDALLFVTSPRSVASPNCAWELAQAMRIGKPCFQWIIEAVEVPYKASCLPVVKLGAGTEDAPDWHFNGLASTTTHAQ